MMPSAAAAIPTPAWVVWPCLAELVGAAPTAVSQHLAKLRLSGLVKGRREGTFVYYSAADVHVRNLLDEALFHADHTDRDLPNHPGADHTGAELPRRRA